MALINDVVLLIGALDQKMLKCVVFKAMTNDLFCHLVWRHSPNVTEGLKTEEVASFMGAQREKLPNKTLKFVYDSSLSKLKSASTAVR